MTKILNCPCGAEVYEVDWTGASEYNGATYQSCFICCTKCDTDVFITVNTDKNHDSELYAEMVTDVWNRLTRD